MAQRILVVEDDDSILLGLRLALRGAGYEVAQADSLRAARGALAAGPDLVLLDLGLPDGDGFALCGHEARGEVPVVILTARGDEADIVRGLDLGADDYVTKPFRTAELLSRIRAVLRRAGGGQRGDVLRCGDVSLDRARTVATAAGVPLSLTAGELRLLEVLLENKGRTLTRTLLLEKLWDAGGEFVNDNTLSVLIKRLREKLGGDAQRIVRTVRGIGYKAVDPDEE